MSQILPPRWHERQHGGPGFEAWWCQDKQEFPDFSRVMQPAKRVFSRKLNGGNIIILFIRGDQGGLQWAHMGRTPTTIIVNVLPPARYWLCWFRKCVILSSTAWMCRVDISLFGVLNIEWRIRKCWRSSMVKNGDRPVVHSQAQRRMRQQVPPRMVSRGNANARSRMVDLISEHHLVSCAGRRLKNVCSSLWWWWCVGTHMCHRTC